MCLSCKTTLCVAIWALSLGAPQIRSQPGFYGAPGEPAVPLNLAPPGTESPGEPTSSLPQCPSYMSIVGESAEDQFGLHVNGTGDVDGDGINDIIVAAPFSDESGNDAGKVYVYSGSTGDLIYSFTGEEEDDWFGLMSISAGDLSNDGFSDIVVGSRLNDIGGFNAGRVYVFSGQTGDLLYVLTGEAGEEFGSSVASGGDVNGDGVDDLVVGAWANSANGTFAGRAYVYSGATMDALHVFTGTSDDDWFGNAVAIAGDVNGDGLHDILIGAMNESGGYCSGEPPFYDDCAGWHGVVYLYSGLDYELIRKSTRVKSTRERYGWACRPQGVNDRFGVTVAAAGDINADGLGDIIIGADGWDNCAWSAYSTETDEGAAFVESPGILSFASIGEAVGDRLGLGIASAGDVDGDGYDDIVYGAWGHDAGGIGAGRAYVRSGRTLKYLFVVDGSNDTDWLGAAVSSVGDINGDGFDDFAVGSPGYYEAGNDRGRVDVFLGGWVCGDANGDMVLTAEDVEALRAAYFESGDLNCAWRTGDLNCDGWLDLADVIHLVGYFYGNGPAPCCQ